MADFSRVELLFNSFLKIKGFDNFSPYEARLINIITSNFNDIAECGTSQGRRARLLNRLIQKAHTNLPNEKVEDSSTTSTFSGIIIQKLNELAIENFRGCNCSLNIPFEKQCTLIYGPNGSGKSSICEALEHCLVGYVREAQIRRLEPLRYIKNSHSSGLPSAKLTGFDITGASVIIRPNPELYEFSFIEKNRIDSFARVSARTPADQTTTIATLFGIDQFNNFVDEFTDNFDRYIIDENQFNIAKFEDKKKSIAQDRAMLEAFEKVVADIERQKTELVVSAGLTDNYPLLEDYVNGSAESPGRIHYIDIELEKPLENPLIPLSSEVDAVASLEELKSTYLEYEKISNEYSSKKDALNLKNLFLAVEQVRTSFPDECPVCKTPISLTTINPYEHAQEKLNELAAIVVLEETRNSSWISLIKASNSLIRIVDRVQQLPEPVRGDWQLPIATILRNPVHIHNIEFIDAILTLIKNAGDSFRDFPNIQERIHKHNEELEARNNHRKELTAEKNILLDLKQNITTLNTKLLTEIERKDQALKNIKAFETNNSTLIEAAKKEAAVLQENLNYLDAYKSLIGKLTHYKSELPIKLVANLSNRTKDFYNAINIGDEKYELLENLQLPTTANTPIKIWFKDLPSKEENALHILSEGHVRCLGLSILLAKAVQEQVPFIIFDDIINAIDDDHRSGIRKLLLEHPDIKVKQLVLSSHAEEFLKQIEMHLSVKDGRNYFQRLNLMRQSKRGIALKESTANYLKLAIQANSENLKREVLKNCRLAMENILEDFWKRLSKTQTYDCRLNVTMLPGNHLELMSVARGLKGRLTKIDAIKFAPALSVLDFFLGLESGHPMIWQYLNSGSHEILDREEFDQYIVHKMLEKLLELDDYVKR